VDETRDCSGSLGYARVNTNEALFTQYYVSVGCAAVRGYMRTQIEMVSLVGEVPNPAGHGLHVHRSTSCPDM
jgi:hypothetical protein